jgi:hypothetical protein
MKSSVFRYPYEKVFRRTQGALARLGMRIISSDALNGSIQAESNFSLTRPSMKIDLIVQEMENHDTKVTITELIVKKGLFSRKVDAEASEAEILENLSTIL